MKIILTYSNRHSSYAQDKLSLGFYFFQCHMLHFFKYFYFHRTWQIYLILSLFELPYSLVNTLYIINTGMSKSHLEIFVSLLLRIEFYSRVYYFLVCFNLRLSWPIPLCPSGMPLEYLFQNSVHRPSNTFVPNDFHP